MAILTKMQKDDYKRWFIEKGDPGFSPERNKAIIEQSITKADKMRLDKSKELRDQYMERADAIITYLKAIDNGRATSQMDRFFSIQNIRHLNGDDYREKLRGKIKEGLEMVQKYNKMRKLTTV